MNDTDERKREKELNVTRGRQCRCADVVPAVAERSETAEKKFPESERKKQSESERLGQGQVDIEKHTYGRREQES